MEEGDGEIFNILEELLAQLGDLLHIFSSLPVASVRNLIDEGIEKETMSNFISIV